MFWQLMMTLNHTNLCERNLDKRKINLRSYVHIDYDLIGRCYLPTVEAWRQFGTRRLGINAIRILILA